METKEADNVITYQSDAFENLLTEINNKALPSELCIILLAGKAYNQKELALNKIKDQVEEAGNTITYRHTEKVDANILFTNNEAETRERIDKLFDEFKTDESILYMVNGANLCGAFTGYSLSNVKYATPQEKYFLKKAKEHKAFMVIDFETIDGIDRTLARAARSIIKFPLPTSGFKGFLARLKQVKVNGFDLNSDRPVNKELKIGNF